MFSVFDNFFIWVYLRKIRNRSSILSPVVQSSSTIAFFSALNIHVFIGGISVLMNLSWLYEASVVASVVFAFGVFFYWYKIRSRHLLKELNNTYSLRIKTTPVWIYITITIIFFIGFQYYSLQYFNWL